MNDKLDIYDIEYIISNIINNLDLFDKCNMIKAAYSELIKLHKRAIYILEHLI